MAAFKQPINRNTSVNGIAIVIFIVIVLRVNGTSVLWPLWTEKANAPRIQTCKLKDILLIQEQAGLPVDL